MRLPSSPLLIALLAAAALAGASGRAAAQSPENVLLVVNESSPASVRIGEYYARARALPANHVVRVKTPAAEAINRMSYERAIEAPVAEWLARHLLQDQILFIVLTKDIPLRIDGTPGLHGTMASVDSELALLYRRMTGAPVLVAGRIQNPYYLGERPLTPATRFSRKDADIYLVTRLDGFTVEDVLKLVDRSVDATREGVIVLDQKATPSDRGGDLWLTEAAGRLADAGHAGRVRLEETRAVATSAEPVFGYFSWGSNDPSNQLRRTGLTFAAGAIGAMFVSTDGRTFREPGPGWKPAPAGSAGGGQSLIGDLIREGITGVSGSVSEPFLDAIVRPQILFPAYLSGYTLGEAYYLAMPFLSWQSIVIGDPLCAPLQSASLPQDRLHAGIDAEMALPALFARRRIAAIGAFDLRPEAVKLQLKAVSLRAQGKPDAEVEVEARRAAEMEPRLIASHLLLAELATGRDDHDTAIERYRAVLRTEPGHVMALNNLAYALAEGKNAPSEALTFAERAYRLSKHAPVVSDTLGWVYYKLNRPGQALPLIERAATTLTGNAEVQVHAAAVNIAMNNIARAKAFLDAALRLDPAIATRDDVKAILLRIKG